jgi:hypothetical protein
MVSLLRVNGAVLRPLHGRTGPSCARCYEWTGPFRTRRGPARFCWSSDTASAAHHGHPHPPSELSTRPCGQPGDKVWRTTTRSGIHRWGQAGMWTTRLALNRRHPQRGVHLWTHDRGRAFGAVSDEGSVWIAASASTGARRCPQEAYAQIWPFSVLVAVREKTVKQRENRLPTTLSASKPPASRQVAAPRITRADFRSATGVAEVGADVRETKSGPPPDNVGKSGTPRRPTSAHPASAVVSRGLHRPTTIGRTGLERSVDNSG